MSRETPTLKTYNELKTKVSKLKDINSELVGNMKALKARKTALEQEFKTHGLKPPYTTKAIKAHIQELNKNLLSKMKKMLKEVDDATGKITEIAGSTEMDSCS